MDPHALQAYLHRHIPLTQGMQIAVLECLPGRIVLRVPIAPNINHRQTLFGGSASAAAILAAWSLVHTSLAAAGVTARVIIQRNTMDYDVPVGGDCFAIATMADVEGWDTFVRTLVRRGRARISVPSTLEFEGTVAGHLAGVFVAFAGA